MCTRPTKAHRLRRDHSVIRFSEPSRSEAFLYEPCEFACRQCVECRVEYGAEWSMRFMQEAQMHERNCVVTLTYDDEHLPVHGDLCERDVQLFMKRLRKKHSELCIAYGYCAEYGDADGRPHYHAILFGFDFGDKVYWKKSASGSKLWKSQECADLWSKGLILVGEMDKDSADYIGRYAVKKVNGKQAEIHYRRVDPVTHEVYQLTPEFLRVSKGRAKPGDGAPFGRGIGARWLEKYFSDVYPADHVVFRGGFERKPPRYYDKLAKRRDAQMLEAIKARREEAMKDPKRLADETPRRREDRDQVVRARLAFKKRPL